MGGFYCFHPGVGGAVFLSSLVLQEEALSDVGWWARWGWVDDLSG